MNVIEYEHNINTESRKVYAIVINYVNSFHLIDFYFIR